MHVWQFTSTVSPRQSPLLLVVTFVALAEVEQNEHVQHHPDKRGGQNHLTVGKSPHPKKKGDRNFKALAEVRDNGEL